MSVSIKILFVLVIVAHTGFALKCNVCAGTSSTCITLDCPAVLGTPADLVCITEPKTGLRTCGVKQVCDSELFECCTTDLCNGSNSAMNAKLMMGIAAALMTITALLWQ